MYEIAEEHGLWEALKIKKKNELKHFLMRQARADTIFSDEEQKKLSFKASKVPSSSQKRRIKSSQTQRSASVNRTPSKTNPPATFPITPLSPTRQLKRSRPSALSPLQRPVSAARPPKEALVISLLSDSDSEDTSIGNWLSKPPAEASSTTSSHTKRLSETIRAPPSPLPTIRSNAPSHINASHQSDEELDEDSDQLFWSDEGTSAVPTHISRALKNEAAKASRQRQMGESSSSSRPKKRGRPHRASRRPAATAAQSAPPAQPSGDEVGLSSTPKPPISRWRHV